MSRGSYVAYNAFFDCGGPWGIIQTVLAAYIEERTGRSFRSFFDSFTGASIGGVNALVLGLGIPAKTLGHAEYACSIDLFKEPSQMMVRHQLLNKRVLHFPLLKDHHDHMILYHTLAPHFQDKVIKNIPLTVLVAAHNMKHKRNFWFGRMDPELFSEAPIKKTLINGTTPLIDAAMATTSIPGVFRPWEFEGEHYRDFGPSISAGKAHKIIDAALQMRHMAARRERREEAVDRRDVLMMGFKRSARNGPRTLGNADSAVVRTLFLGTGDLNGLPYTKAVQNNAGFLGAIDDQEYSSLHMVKQTAQQDERDDMEAFYDEKTIAATTQPAITRINKSLVWSKDDPFERETFPSLTQTDCSRENLHKVFYFAGLNVEQHMTTIASFLQEVTTNQLAQGKIERVEYDRMSAICTDMAHESPWPLLEKSGILVTAHNGPAIYETYRARVPQVPAQDVPRKNMIGRAASMAAGLWRRPTATVG